MRCRPIEHLFTLAFVAIWLTSCAARPLPPTPPTPTASTEPIAAQAAPSSPGAPAVPGAPSAPAGAPSSADLVDRVVAALVGLDGPDGMAFTATTTRREDQYITANAQPIVDASWVFTVTTQGTRIVRAGRPEADLARVFSLDVGGPTADPTGITIDGKARLVDGQAYMAARYARLTNGFPALPGGWTRFYTTSTFALWPAMHDLELGNDLYARLGSDPAAMLSGWRSEQIRATLTRALAEAGRETGSLPGVASSGEIVTFKLKATALLVSLTDVDFSNPANYAIFDAVRGAPITHRFQLDASGRLVGWDRDIDVTWRNVDASLKSGLPDNTRAAGAYREHTAIRIAVSEGAPAPLSAPAAGDFVALPAYDQPGAPPVPFATLADFESQLNQAVTGQTLDAFWAKVSAGRMPLIFGRSTAVFLWRGPGKAVNLTGGWTPFLGAGSAQPGSGLWLMAGHFPSDARIEYQIAVDGKEQLDPLNPLAETGGLGSQSYFAMPDYRFPGYVTQRPGVAQGRLSDNIRIHSTELGYDVDYRVYTPAGYDAGSRLPTIYVTDGQDYLQFGHMATALDNLIADGAIRPIIAVFIDPRDTVTGRNQRNEQFFDNPKYGAFIVSELVPAVERAYAADPSPDARAILGASNGGYHSAYFALHHADAFHLIGMQSPNVDYNRDIIKAYQSGPRLPVKMYLNVGEFEWLVHGTRELARALESQGYALRYVEVPDLHSYANWRAQFGDMLSYFFGK